ncbi:50S ribosomal protein L29 [candidate division WOR-1 bacterium RIFOXYA12_FULL_52_29]|uniref:Large ribosomal subunit protein uL29 n=1 Tax=candidate division WOR-1 bacterium RIFOXYC12_FULL_54_18 TaxID=1802584 RepID=A0A1F4T661_UNCSA|nr:MAG: 50S ribosomal protein L29 [candidate division WOR-1 bacterium RIFOXYA2_FULL_51_19]OGC17582.1 MAG: 50S ribosomal protein L29 [candidate division WOR-1 bacterium RIFOXYA12_FULL_52_29]OGC26439.1 MAG: 50S ribosomal protein L29 [candidate division WOR-1 bacterium RIFOXYB2_FULL_45_9]OGC27999.1 MAG: 50S ribosomal protein L29 [candidate division WOR-1 bacterium RIFOXYC12_FULL_54_18]OGC29715.1 MAG: 50S ribosomal protein L29 [candidate division WOR-1 bacterium RIFOXYB12_FULL_52_16]
MNTKELRELTVSELAKKAGDLRKELFTLRLQKSNQQVKNPLKQRELRRTIARVLTIAAQKNQKNNEQPVKSKEGK